MWPFPIWQTLSTKIYRQTCVSRDECAIDEKLWQQFHNFLLSYWFAHRARAAIMALMRNDNVVKIYRNLKSFHKKMLNIVYKMWLNAKVYIRIIFVGHLQKVSISVDAK